jgi:hypothetical protein
MELQELDVIADCELKIFNQLFFDLSEHRLDRSCRILVPQWLFAFHISSKQKKRAGTPTPALMEHIDNASLSRRTVVRALCLS